MKFNQLEYMAAKGVANGTLVLKRYVPECPGGSPVCFWTVYKDGREIGTYSRYGTYYANFLDSAIEGRLLRAAMDYARQKEERLKESETLNKLIGKTYTNLTNK